MLLFRWIAILLLLTSAGYFAFYLGTGQPHYKRMGFIVFKWTLIAASVFFAVLIADRVL